MVYAVRCVERPLRGGQRRRSRVARWRRRRITGSLPTANTLDAMAKRKGEKSAASSPRSLDLEQFSSLEDALAKVKPGDRYLDVGAMLRPLEEGMPLTLPVMF